MRCVSINGDECHQTHHLKGKQQNWSSARWWCGWHTTDERWWWCDTLNTVGDYCILLCCEGPDTVAESIKNSGETIVEEERSIIDWERILLWSKKKVKATLQSSEDGHSWLRVLRKSERCWIKKEAGLIVWIVLAGCLFGGSILHPRTLEIHLAARIMTHGAVPVIRGKIMRFRDISSSNSDYWVY